MSDWLDWFKAAAGGGILLCLAGMGPRFFPTDRQTSIDHAMLCVGLALVALALPVVLVATWLR